MKGNGLVRNLLTLLTIAIGCNPSPSEEEFLSESIAVTCELAFECGDADDYFEFDDLDGCTVFFEERAASIQAQDCDFDAEEAEQCIEDLSTADCDALFENSPACDAVHTGDDCG